MSALAGVLAEGPLTWQFTAGAAYTLHNQWRLPYTDHVGAAALALFGSIADTQPLAIAHQAEPGQLAARYSDDYYHRIHVTPAALALGNLISRQVRTVEVWNAHLGARDLASIAATGADGLTFDAVAPHTYAPLDSEQYSLAVSLDGPPTIDAAYLFDFGAETPRLTVTGARVIIFSIAPHWAEPLTERLEWLTEVATAYAGAEQRRQLRAAPRRSLEYALMAHHEELAYLDALLWAWQSRVFAVPVWTDASLLAGPLAPGATVIAVDTADTDYHAGGLAVLYRDARTTESAEIDTVAPDRLTLKRGLLNAWGVGTRLMPARTARLTARQALDRTSAALGAATVHFDLLEPDPIAAGAPATTYRDLAVWLDEPNRSATLTQTYARELATLDNQTGVRFSDDHAARGFSSRALSYLLANRTQAAAFKGWLAARAGRLNAYWQPSWNNDISLTAPIGASQQALLIRDIGYARFCQGQSGRQDLAFQHRNGQWLCRRVVSAQAHADGTETINLDTALGIAAEPGDFNLICYLSLSRLNTDAVELAWQSAGIATVALAAQEIAA